MTASPAQEGPGPDRDDPEPDDDQDNPWRAWIALGLIALIALAAFLVINAMRCDAMFSDRALSIGGSCS